MISWSHHSIITIRLVFVSFQSFLWHQGNNWILFSHISQSEGRLPSEIKINSSTAAISQKLQIEKSFYLFILSPSLLREMEENIVPHPVSFLTAVFQLVELWNSFYMTFPLIYIEHVTRNFFLIYQIISPHRLVCWWTSTIVIYRGIIDLLLHHLSLGNWM